jgi:flagellar assembly protein FliH
MTSMRGAGWSHPPVVLRGVLLQAPPHALTRPDPLVSELVRRPQPSEPDDASCGNEARSGRSTAEAAYEAGLEDGRKQGYETAAAVALREARERESALAELRALSAAEGRLEGLTRGREEALAAASQAEAEAAQRANQAAADRLGRVDLLLKGLLAEEARRLEAAEDDMVALCHETVCRILGAEAAQPERVRFMVLHLLAQHGQRAELAVHVHPDDFVAVVEELDGDERPWRWVEDAAVQLGGVVLRSPQGSLDARLETQVAALGEALLAQRRVRKEAAGRAGQEEMTTGAT